ncbi:hypothetical protein V5O48_005772 [Marasmius crinis-equi]|uniref:Lipoyl-binding domain-containing protein n=1 Tax=Marasmius crinis-equi TaxID=585013 RepID=A0ABR3FLS1_9AGAR
MATVMGSISRVARSTGSGHVRRRSFHSCRPANAILMPALSPMMTEGTVTRWNKKEGEMFAAGDILLQIEYGLNYLDVRAELPGVLGKILTPEGSTNVPVEHVIALVARDRDEFVREQFVPVPAPSVRRIRAPSPIRVASGPRSVSPSPISTPTYPSSPRPVAGLRFHPHMAHEPSVGGMASARGITMDHRAAGDQRPRIRIPASMCMSPLSGGPGAVQSKRDGLPGATVSSGHSGNEAGGWGQDTRIFNGLMD